jgi:hypothetical protein
MKKMNLKLLAAFVGALMVVLISSCQKDEETPGVDYNPVLNANFSYVVNGNNVVFTTTIPGNVWFTCNGVDYPTVDKTVTVFLANAGTYIFTCSTLGSGSTLTSDDFDIVILQDDLSFLDEGVWKLLTGGQGHSKTWVLDINADGEVTNLWYAPVAYSGKDGDPYYYWDYIPTDSTDVTYLNWSPKYSDNTWLMPAMDYGTMTFTANDQTLTTVRPAEDVTSETGTVAIDLETMLMTLTGTTICRDLGRITDVEDWQHFRIYKITENSMSLGVKRVLDGGNPGPWVVLYNFVTKTYKDAYVAPEIVITDPVVDLPSINLVGTWKFVKETPINWYEFNNTVPLDWAFSNAWNGLADYEASSWAGYVTADTTNLMKQSLTFNANMTFSAVDSSNTTKTGNYTYNSTTGVVSFDAYAKFQIGTTWMNAITKVDPPVDWRIVRKEEDGSIWFGLQETPSKYKSVHFRKVE